jgi:crotonobetainyl-CoA:carnitine CoA-transferase CaiB-like acyl-CoA transferase
MTFLGSGRIPQPLGTGFATVAPYRAYRAQDRYIGVAVGSEKLWASFCKALNRPDLYNHPHYATNPLRVVNRKALDDLLSAIFVEHPASHWTEVLNSAGVPCSPVNTFADVASHAQARIREMFPVLEGCGPVTGPPVKLSATPGQVGIRAPLLGEHTREVLSELLEIEDAKITELIAQGVVNCR